MLIVLLRFSKSVSRVAKVSDRTKYLSLNDEPCLIRTTLIGFNPVEVKYYPSMISLDKCSGSCNVLSPKHVFRKNPKDINFKEFNMTTGKNEAKTMLKHISFDCKCKRNSTTCNLNPTWNNEKCQCDCTNYRKYKKDYRYNPNTCTLRITSV